MALASYMPESGRTQAALQEEVPHPQHLLVWYQPTSSFSFVIQAEFCSDEIFPLPFNTLALLFSDLAYYNQASFTQLLWDNYFYLIMSHKTLWPKAEHTK